MIAIFFFAKHMPPRPLEFGRGGFLLYMQTGRRSNSAARLAMYVR